MREILFRGKRIEDGEWVCGDLWNRPYGKNAICIVSFMEDTGTTVGLEVIPETVGQYTGLKDKNGVKIFEGDILRDDESIVIVKFFVDGGFSVDYRTPEGKWGGYGDLHDYLEMYKGEVVGNVHDNPGLVEVLI